MANVIKPARRRLSSYWSKPKRDANSRWLDESPLVDSPMSTDVHPTIDRTEARRIEAMMEQAYMTTLTTAASTTCWYESEPLTGLAPPNWAPPPPPIAELPVTAESPVELPAMAVRASLPRPRSGIRRRAKTPVRRIGQLEMAERQKRAEALDRTWSVGSVAGQHRASICSPAIMNSGTVGSRKEHSLPPLHIVHEETRGRSRFSPSPISDDGTLVSVDEDSIYFKPFSTSVTPLPLSEDISHVSDHDDAVCIPEPLQCQIGLDLLRGELSSALVDPSTRAHRDAAALQIWVMIQAYERLRDHVAKTTSPSRELQDAAAMFEYWLTTLYNIQQSMAYDAAMSDSEYEED